MARIRKVRGEREEERGEERMDKRGWWDKKCREKRER